MVLGIIPSKITNFIYVQRILSLIHPLFSFKTCPLYLEEIQESTADMKSRFSGQLPGE